MPPDAAALARLIADDLRRRAPFRSLVAELRGDLAGAYAVQDALAGLLQQDGLRGPLAGYKIALNAPALQRHFGVDEPCAAPLFADQLHRDGARLEAGGLHRLVIEPELAVVLGRDLGPAACDHATVAAAIGRIVPAFELIDLRGAEFPDFDLASAVAQNITNEGAVLGGPGVAGSALDLAALATRLVVNGKVVAEVRGAAPQHPVDAVAWLAGHLAARGRGLLAGMVVLCGSHVPPLAIDPPAEVAVTMEGLGGAAFALA